jgi:outer membrane receptor protein involved in Fe transport
MRNKELAAALVTGTCLVAMASPAQAQERKFNIPATNLKAALDAYGRQAGQPIIYKPDEVRAARSNGFRGVATPQAALQAVLANSGFASRPGSTGAIAVVRVGNASADAAAEADAGNDVAGEDIVVTAQKREERLLEVPLPVTALTAQNLVNSNQLRLQDYYTRVPGLSLTLLGDEGVAVPSIRGITTGGYTNPTVGVVVDDVPFGASTSAGFAFETPDFDPTELSRIEVLRGPQGTLYGASSMGGLLKFVTVDPDPRAFSGRVQAGISAVEKGDELGFAVRGAVNIPVSDTFAIRASGSVRRDPGYIDDPALGLDGVNRLTSYSARLAALWKPSSDFSLRLSALHQKTERDGESVVDLLPGLGDLEHQDLRNTGQTSAELWAFSATARVSLGNADLTSLTGYSINKNFTNIDVTPITFLSNLTNARFGVAGIANPFDLETRKFSQEVRLSMPLGADIDWLVGGFYTREDYPSFSEIIAIDPANGKRAGTWFSATRDGNFSELAGFTNLTFRVTDRFEIQGGARYSRVKLETGAGHTVGPWNTDLLGQSSEIVDTPAFNSRDDAFTFSVAPKFSLSDDVMIYARVASGYRAGGPNTALIAQASPTLRTYQPDTTVNYEIGTKGKLADGVLTFDLSVYQINWNDLQIQLRDPATFQVYISNTGKARSRGIEASVEIKPARNTTFAGWVAVNDAEIRSAPGTSDLAILRGDRLPYSSPVSANVSIDQRFDIGADAELNIGAALSFVDDRKGAFQPAGTPREIFPSYAQLDLRAGLRVADWDAALYVNNVTDTRGVLRSGSDSTFGFPYMINYIQPRTFGVSLARSF